MASGGSGFNAWNNNLTSTSGQSPWSGGRSTQNASVTSLQDVMKEQQTESSTKDQTYRSRDDFKFVSSEPWYPGKVNRNNRGRGASSANRRPFNRPSSGRPTSGTPTSGDTALLDIYSDYDALSKQTGMQVANVHKKDLMKNGYKNLEDWVKVPGHMYIGRDMTRYVPGAVGSKWHNPFKSKQCSREQSCQQFKDYIRTNKKIHENGKTLYQSLDELKGKTIGCWCHPERCHGHMLMELVSEVCG